MALAAYRRTRRLWFSREGWQRRLVFWGGGVLVGLAAVIFATLADAVQELFAGAIASRPWLPLLVTPAGLALSAWLTRSYFPNAGGSGIPQAIAARELTDQRERTALVSIRLAVGKVLLTLVGLGVGASIGREGPTVQVGASLMHRVGASFGGRFPGLLLAGGAAGVAAAFNTPLAGIVFAIEEMGRAFDMRTGALVLAAVTVAGAAPLAIQGDYLYFGQSTAHMATWQDWTLVPLCGVLGGLAGGAFSRVVVRMAKGIGHWPGRAGRAGRWIKAHPVPFAALCGLALALLGLATGGDTYGTGYAQAKALLESASHPDAAAAVSPLFGPAKWLATALSSISGIPGGIFSPSLAVGAGVGAELGRLVPGANPEVAVLVGMVGYFAGVVQAPITAFVIVLEMTGNHALAVPIMAGSLIGCGAARMMGAEAIYHALSHGFLDRAHQAIKARGPSGAR
ncbi:chloride channel protein [Azospirillum sp. B4]|uniref:chloride channel protein n=1 Tax=Azospirillum sp. B4 TaxID=95605 RepID=UPI00034D5160|nr:chloride channel protein [Azospirillum sp. B4]